jgi:hypothetical protein
MADVSGDKAAGIVMALIPDDEDFEALLGQVEEPLLLQLALAEEAPDEGDGGDPYTLPPPLAGRVTLQAWYRIWAGLRNRMPPQRYRLRAPDGRYQYLPLHVVRLEQTDLVVLDAALHALNRALLPSGDPNREVDLAELLHEIAQSWASGPPGGWGRTPTAATLVGDLGRILAVLTLPPDDDTRLLVTRLTEASAGDVVLTAAEEAAYRRLAGRLNLLLADNNPIDRFKYDG